MRCCANSGRTAISPVESAKAKEISIMQFHSTDHRQADNAAGTSTDSVPRPLEGIRIVESASFLTGPYAATLLADLGAEVIKVEPPGGDGFRTFGHKQAGWSALWSSANRGKRSIELNLKNADDLGVMKQLLKTADVLVENWRPHVAGNLGLSQDVVSALNPRLVRLSITGFGPDGPMAAEPAYDSLIQARTGMLDLVGPGRDPEVAPYWVVDKVVGIFGAQSILTALVQRQRTGRGCHVSLPMLDVMAYFNFADMFQHRTFVADQTPWKPPFSPVVRTADGHLVISPVSGAQMSRTLKALQRPDVIEELKAITDSTVMVEVFYRRLGEILVTQPSSHWLEVFKPFDIPVAQVFRLEEHLSDPQVEHNQIYRELDTPAGAMRTPRYPARYDGQAIAPAGAPPSVGQDSSALRDELASA